MKIAGFHEGDRSEFLAEFALSTIGLCIPVPRTADYFVTDFLVYLTRPKKQMLELLGLTFAAQVKSTTETIEFKGKDQLHAFFTALTPFFVVVISKDRGLLQVFTTLHRLLIPSKYRAKKWTLQFGGDRHQVDLGNRTLFLGPPIAEVKLDELDDLKLKTNRRNLFRHVMMSWVMLETAAAAGSFVGVPWIPLPDPQYETNKPVPLGDYKYAHVLDPRKAKGVVMSSAMSIMALSSYLRECLPELSNVAGLKTQLKKLNEAVKELDQQLTGKK